MEHDEILRYKGTIADSPARRPFPGVELHTIAYNQRIMTVYINLKAGASVPMHEHEAVQSSFIVSGRVRIIAKDEIECGAGSCRVFGSWEKHGLEALEDTIIVESFSPIRLELVD